MYDNNSELIHNVSLGMKFAEKKCGHKLDHLENSHEILPSSHRKSVHKNKQGKNKINFNKNALK